jgi:hypothetical protein
MQFQKLESDMANQLLFARQQANKLRFAGDLSSEVETENIGQTALIRRASYESAIELSSLLTPELHKRFCSGCERIHVPPDLVTAFIYSSGEIQGECYADGRGCVVRFSSGLVDLLDADEFEFVVGHELGHFLLAHHAVNAQSHAGRFEYFRRRRAQEISCDRIGLSACGSLDVALRAMMKTASGLTSRHLRFDVLAFIAQLRKLEGAGISGLEATHPSLLLRAKAMLWFSLCDLTGLASGRSASFDQLRVVDERIERDLARFIDGAVSEQITRLKEDMLLWTMANEIVQRGVFTADMQSQMRHRFDEELVQKLRSFLRSLPKATAESEVFQRQLAVRHELEAIIPDKVVETVSTLNEEARRILQLDHAR